MLQHGGGNFAGIGNQSEGGLSFIKAIAAASRRIMAGGNGGDGAAEKGEGLAFMGKSLNLCRRQGFCASVEGEAGMLLNLRDGLDMIAMGVGQQDCAYVLPAFALRFQRTSDLQKRHAAINQQDLLGPHIEGAIPLT